MVTHSDEQCRTKWKNLKKDAKQYNSRREVDQFRTSGGGVSEVPENEIFELVMAVVKTYEREAIAGVENTGELAGGLYESSFVSRNHGSSRAINRGRQRRTSGSSTSTAQSSLLEAQLGNEKRKEKILEAKLKAEEYRATAEKQRAQYYTEKLRTKYMAENLDVSAGESDDNEEDNSSDDE
uniref:HTH myb-type domain-containing protein n=1 Tax=Ditylenchus dipsaci TaxID=166011 RepID=A0A915EW36_9BILA